MDLLNLTADHFDVGLDVCENELRELAVVLDEPVKDEFLQRAVIGLATRARSYFIGFLELS